MKTVTLTELRRNLETYLDESKECDIVITKYGRAVAKLIGTESELKANSGNSGDGNIDAEADMNVGGTSVAS
jgi:prevent-host-death family protein